MEGTYFDGDWKSTVNQVLILFPLFILPPPCPSSPVACDITAHTELNRTARRSPTPMTVHLRLGRVARLLLSASPTEFTRPLASNTITDESAPMEEAYGYQYLLDLDENTLSGRPPMSEVVGF
ncbi:hypothetical protein C8R45DRAFT_1103974 [Mycena sanguinolenta]|nr:hypothetical protein C8R45DRAFT_1103974 [Mycena sanguinolenta]